MKKIYYGQKCDYIDWMGYKITEDNCPTYRHIEKACNLENDELTIENGSYLGKRSHELLHRIEQFDKELYIKWNNLFRLINDSKRYPDDKMKEYMKLLKMKLILEIYFKVRKK